MKNQKNKQSKNIPARRGECGSSISLSLSLPPLINVRDNNNIINHALFHYCIGMG